MTALLWRGAAAKAPLRAALAGAAMVALASLACLPRAKRLDIVLIPVRAYGTNPLLAFILCWSLFPWLDVKGEDGTNAREAGQAVLVHLLPPRHASMLFGLIAAGLLVLPLVYCRKKGWVLRL